MKKFVSLFLIPCLSILYLFPGSLFAEEAENTSLTVEAPSAVLMEASTGTILYEKNSHEQRRPASVTKIMTLLLIFEALEQGQIQKSDVVTVSEYAASMGGSQVYLEAGETQTVEDLIKCISIASANDACVAMAEFISGSEEAFVEKMNEKAKALGMNDTTFRNCCGLEAEGHLTSAYDIALMSRELSVNHPDIYNYCTIWMDTIIHTTRRGSEEFGLTNTNKLLRYYSYATGLKTGYTSQSGYCLSATAEKDDVHLIAVVMAEESPTVRNKDAVALLNYGFANCTLYTDENTDPLPSLLIKKGTADTVSLSYENSFSAILLNGAAPGSVEKTLVLPEEATAPVESGQEAGKVVYTQDNTEIGSVRILYADSVPALTYKDCFVTVLLRFFLYA
jgi:D-alanyl-D-alanine carboxypeptidase (penicillin-binding protein 5/6)